MIGIISAAIGGFLLLILVFLVIFGPIIGGVIYVTDKVVEIYDYVKDSVTEIFDETFEPPRTATSGLTGLLTAFPRNSISFWIR